MIYILTSLQFVHEVLVVLEDLEKLLILES